MFSVEAKRWRPLRTKFSPTFSSGKLKDMFYLLQQCSTNFGKYMDRLVQQKPVINCRAITAKFTADGIGTCVFGVDLNTLNDEDCEFLRVAKRMMKPSKKAVFKDVLRRMLPRVYDLIGKYLSDKEVEKFFIKTVIDTIEFRWKHNIIRHDFVDILQDLRKHPEKLPELGTTRAEFAPDLELTADVKFLFLQY